MKFFDSVMVFIDFVVRYWVDIVVIAGLGVLAWRLAKKYFETDTEKKIEIIKKQVANIMLKLVTDAEERYADWNKAGAIKRSQVIERIYEAYPVLKMFADQDAILRWIDVAIDAALETMREIVKQNAK